MITTVIAALAEGRDLTRAEARAVMGAVMGGHATPAQIGALLLGLRAKGETVDEITGFAEAMREHVVPVVPTRSPVVDVVGTGGDGAGTFNISTAAAIVAAASSAAVAKHGNRAASSACGSADVLEALGFDLELPPERIASSIDEHGFGFMFARAHHPAMRHAAAVRQELGTRTVFNVLGPLANPAGARDGVFGVFAPSLARTYAESLAALGARRALVVHGDGMDELNPTSVNLVVEVRDGDIVEWELDPRSLGIEPGDPAELRGGSPSENAAAIRRLLGGERGVRRQAVLLNAAGALVAAGVAEDLAEGLGIEPGDPAELRGGSPAVNAAAIRQLLGGERGVRRQAVLLNAAGALVAAGVAEDLAEGLGAAAEAIDSGAAGETLERLVAYSREVPV